MKYAVYCDESCHLEHDNIDVMTLCAVWCAFERRREFFERIREIKAHHSLPAHFEVKWSKIFPAKLEFYKELVEYFFQEDGLHFRGLIVRNKSSLCHAKFKQDHDDWYYKMYFTMLKQILSPTDSYKIFVDIKDTRGAEKLKKLHMMLAHNMYDFSRSIVENIKLVHSSEVELVQMADLFCGALSYENRGLQSNTAKQALIQQIKDLSGYTLRGPTLLKENKFNIFVWQPQEHLDE